MSDPRPYIRVSDSIADNPKMVAVDDDAASWLLVAMWGYSHREDTDGRVPQAVAHRMTKSASKRLCQKLITAGLLQVDGLDYICHDYLEHQQSAEQRAAARERAAVAGRAGGLAKGQRFAKQSASKPLSKNEAEVEIEVQEQKTSSSEPRKRATAAPDIFPITDAMKAWGRQNAPLVRDPEAETRQFLDHHRAKGSTFKDWTAAWRTWMSNAQKYAGERRGPVRAELRPADAWLENM